MSKLVQECKASRLNVLNDFISLDEGLEPQVMLKKLNKVRNFSLFLIVDVFHFEIDLDELVRRKSIWMRISIGSIEFVQ